MANYQIQLRRSTAAQWSARNPVLANGEPGYEYDTKQLKIGDGVTSWNSLDYVPITGPAGPQGPIGPQGPAGSGGGGGGPSISATAPLRYNSSTGALSIDNPPSGIIIDGENF
jgi:hypothetical protein